MVVIAFVIILQYRSLYLPDRQASEREKEGGALKNKKMQRQAFILKLHKGYEAEYKKRHDELWPELQALLKQTGIQEYSIFLDEQTNNLFGYLQVNDAQAMDDLPKHPVMQRWWNYMKDIMETNPDASPVSIPLKEVFYMP
ncbi:MAG: L-rhamnose mutarotase [Agriterribacter sp.]